MQKIAIITGADSGLGREYTQRIAEDLNIDEVWALAKTPARLQRLVQDFGQRIIPVEIDLTDPIQLADFHRRLTAEQPRIFWLINNAGSGKFGPFEKIKTLEAVQIVDLNCRAVIAMTSICLPYMTAGSRIINTASQAAFQPLPYFSVYAASKAFIDRFSMALTVELKPRGIAVTSVCPGWMRTPFLIKAKTDTHPSVIRPFPITDPAWVAARALADSRKGKFRSIYGILTRISGWTAKLLSQNLIMMLWLMQQGWSGGSAFQRSCLREAKLAEEAKLRLKLLERHQNYD